MRLPDDAEVHWWRVGALAVYLIAIVVLAFVIPAVGWMLIALTLLTGGVLLNPSSRAKRRRGRRPL